MLKVMTVVGARPQFIKAALVSEAMRGRCAESLVHTGQHYDRAMSQAHFDDLNMRPPDYSLDVGSGSHGAQTAEMLRRLESLMERDRPDAVLVYGDTNSTLAGALAAAKLDIPVAHVEAGLRSFNRSMPEEINRVVTDHLSRVLFAPNDRAADQLLREGIGRGVSVVGDVMVDLVKRTVGRLPARPAIVERLDIEPGRYGVLTIHRASNTDDPATFARLLGAARRLPFPVVFPVHPRSQRLVDASDGRGSNVRAIEPLSYRTMLALTRDARVVLTDSGGLQKEAYVLGVPCVTLRTETEWVETLEGGWNELTGADEERIVASALRERPTAPRRDHYGDGDASRRIVDGLSRELGDAGNDPPR